MYTLFFEINFYKFNFSTISSDNIKEFFSPLRIFHGRNFKFAPLLLVVTCSTFIYGTTFTRHDNIQPKKGSRIIVKSNFSPYLFCCCYASTRFVIKTNCRLGSLGRDFSRTQVKPSYLVRIQTISFSDDYGITEQI